MEARVLGCRPKTYSRLVYSSGPTGYAVNARGALVTLSCHFRVTFVKVASASWTRALASVVSAAENKLSPWTILLVGCHLIGHEALGRFFWPILRRDSSSLVPQSAAGRLVSSSSSSVVLNGLFLRLMFLGHGSSLLGHGSPAIVLKLSRPIPMAGLLSDATVTSISARFEMSTRCISDWYHWRVYHRRHKSRVLHQFPRFSQILPDSPRFSQILPDSPRFSQRLLHFIWLLDDFVSGPLTWTNGSTLIGMNGSFPLFMDSFRFNYQFWFISRRGILCIRNGKRAGALKCGMEHSFYMQTSSLTGLTIWDSLDSFKMLWDSFTKQKRKKKE